MTLTLNVTSKILGKVTNFCGYSFKRFKSYHRQSWRDAQMPSFKKEEREYKASGHLIKDKLKLIWILGRIYQVKTRMVNNGMHN